jgi:hypothetical protein
MVTARWKSRSAFSRRRIRHSMTPERTNTRALAIWVSARSASSRAIGRLPSRSWFQARQ